MTQIYKPARRGNRRNLWAPLAVVTTAVIIGAIIATVFLTTKSTHHTGSTNPGNPGTLFNAPSPLAETSTTCDAGILADDDHTLVVDMAGEDTSTGIETFDGVLCVLDDLDAPQALVARMESTRALDGMQSATWSSYEVTWTYHPDDGLDLIITYTD
jgi:hypothetical protein